MLTKNSDVNDIKHYVLTLVAKYAFEGTLDEKRDEIPFEIIPKHKALFRCCVYREREISRQRIRLAEGKFPREGQSNRNIVQVIDSACAECPIQRFVVTDNCQKCVGKKCLKACTSNAITIGRDKAYIDPEHCKECGKCAEACPYDAISDHQRPCKRSCPVGAINRDEDGIVAIDEDKCIHCGNCIRNCPFGAISELSFMVPVINALKSEQEVYAMVAPAAEGQFGEGTTMGDLREALLELGFTDVVEVALGADLTAESESKEWLESYKKGEKKVTSCCPAFVAMTRRHFPQLYKAVSTTISPMAATSRYLKSLHPGAMTVFIGPCIAKKSEVIDEKIPGNANYALTLKEIMAMLNARGITMRPQGIKLQQGSIYARSFAKAGGVTEAVIEALAEQGIDEPINVCRASGAKECKNALTRLAFGGLKEDFIEGMCCEGGCVNGPGNYLLEAESKRDRKKLQDKLDDRTITDTVEKARPEWDGDMHRSL